LQRALGEHLELRQLIGRGGYAEVYAVRDLKLKRDLAIKVLRPDLILTPSLLARFRREAEAVAALQHSSIVPVFDIRETNGICFIVMPLIRGESLKAVLQRQRRLPIDEVQRIVLESANALAVAHKANIVHRDIKPENIMLEGSTRQVRLMDFGIAKAVDSGDKGLTGTGVVVGTPQYMSPEQASGEPQIDHRSDQYSLAVVAYQMLSGRAPFDGETARAIITKQLLDQPPALSTLVENLPAHLAAALHRAMQKSPKNRFDSIEEFAAALQDPKYHNPVELEVAQPEAIVPPRPRRMAGPLLTGAVGLAAAVVAIIALSPPPRPAASAPLAPPDPPPPASVASPSIAARPTPPPPAVVPVAAPRQTRDSSSAPTGELATVVATTPDSVVTPPVPPSCAALLELRDWTRAVDRCGEEGNAGNAVAARSAAEILIEGRGGVLINEKRAIELYQRAAHGDDTPAQMWLAQRFENGEPSLSTEMYRAAARKSHTPAYRKLAERLETGLGTAKDLVAAATWYERAAGSGDVLSQLKVAEIYQRGRGKAKNDSTAAWWYQRAASANNHEAQYRLALMYFQGAKGIPKSEAQGLTLLQQAAAGGHEGAKKELDRRKG
jgi:serine/threonine-protein kinase